MCKAGSVSGRLDSNSAEEKKRFECEVEGCIKHEINATSWAARV